MKTSLSEIHSRFENESDSEGTWAISYGDMVTLLLAFFVMFFSFQTSKKEMAIANQQKLMSVASENIKKNLPNSKVHEVGKTLIVEFPEISFFGTAGLEVLPEAKKQLEAFVATYLPYAGKSVLHVNAFTDPRPVIQGRYRFYDNLELSALRGTSAIKILQKAGIPLREMRVGGYGEAVDIVRELANGSNSDQQNEKLLALARKIVIRIEPKGDL